MEGRCLPKGVRSRSEFVRSASEGGRGADAAVAERGEARKVNRSCKFRGGKPPFHLFIIHEVFFLGCQSKQGREGRGERDGFSSLLNIVVASTAAAAASPLLHPLLRSPFWLSSLHNWEKTLAFPPSRRPDRIDARKDQKQEQINVGKREREERSGAEQRRVERSRDYWINGDGWMGRDEGERERGKGREGEREDEITKLHCN